MDTWTRFVVHDWGSALGFDWANRNRDRVLGMADNPDIQVVVGTRAPEKWRTPGTDVVRLDLDRVETLVSALEGVERAFLVTGYTVDMLRQNKDFLNAAKRAGVKHVVHLGACGDDDTRVDHYAWHQLAMGQVGHTCMASAETSRSSFSVAPLAA